MKETLIEAWRTYCTATGILFSLLILSFFIFGGHISIQINVKESISEFKNAIKNRTK
jgi:hypothetical protein